MTTIRAMRWEDGRGTCPGQTLTFATRSRYDEPMAGEEKKPRIDLKARLGKTQVGAGAGARVAPAMPGAGRPGGSAPPPGYGSTPPRAPAYGSVPPPAVGGGYAGGAAPGVPVGVPVPPFAGAA